LNIDLQGNKADVVANELSALPGITSISKSAMITSIGSYWGDDVKYKDPMDSIQVDYNLVDENYIPNLKIALIAGHNFRPKPEGSTEDEVIVNQQLLKQLNFKNNDPNQAVGEMLTFDNKKAQIIGVVKDFHYGKVDSKIGPFMFRQTTKDFQYLNVKIQPDNIQPTMKNIEKAWKKIDNIHPLETYFYNDMIKDAYSEYSSMMKAIGFLSLLAIIIASMGLLGMVVYSTQTKIREISIRKVFGAGIGNLIYLLSKSFIFLLSVSAFIAIPVTYLVFKKIILADIVYHPPIGLPELFTGTLIVLMIAVVLISSQTIKVAQANPSDVLRNE